MDLWYVPRSNQCPACQRLADTQKKEVCLVEGWGALALPYASSMRNFAPRKASGAFTRLRLKLLCGTGCIGFRIFAICTTQAYRGSGKSSALVACINSQPPHY